MRKTTHLVPKFDSEVEPHIGPVQLDRRLAPAVVQIDANRTIDAEERLFQLLVGVEPADGFEIVQAVDVVHPPDVEGDMASGLGDRDDTVPRVDDTGEFDDPAVADIQWARRRIHQEAAWAVVYPGSS